MTGGEIPRHYDGRPFWYDRAGNPIDAETAERLLGDDEARRVALDRIGDAEISTVHLVLDHDLGIRLPGDDSPPVPLIFETMIFAADDDEIDGQCMRTPNETAALAAHDQACALVRSRVAAQ